MNDLTASQLAEWEAYNTLEPVGDYRQDYMMAQLTSIFYNFASSFGSKDGRRKIAKIPDFIPWMEQPEEKEADQSLSDMKKSLLSLAKKDKEKKKKIVKQKPKFPKPFKGAPVVDMRV